MCTLCDGTPKCVEYCPFGALAYIQGGFDTTHHALPPEKIAAELIQRWYPGEKIGWGG